MQCQLASILSLQAEPQAQVKLLTRIRRLQRAFHYADISTVRRIEYVIHIGIQVEALGS
jgi:hypothetical protein